MALHNKVVMYVNGVRIWPESVTVLAQTGGYVRFTVSVPAVKEWTILPKRSHAVVFYMDPLTSTWRLMCEGEYVGRSKTKTGEGQRALSLMFEGLHAAWDRITFTNMSSLLSPAAQSQDRQDSVALSQLSARANGRILNVPSQDSRASSPLTDFNSLVDRTTGPATRISGFLPNFIKQAVQQTPVDSYYMAARKWVQKMFALIDEEIGFILDRTRANDFIKNGFNTMGLGPNATLHQIVTAYENMAMYHHVPILNPPIYKTSDDARDTTGIQIIPEMMFLPFLYHTVPPACNVIFADQVSSFNETRNFITEPTRVIARLEVNQGPSTGIPVFYMVNSSGSENVVRAATNPAMPPALSVTHDMFSREELDMGVISRFVGVGIEKLTGDPNNEDTAPSLEAYMVNAARHHYEVERKKTISQQVTCTFLPYIVPGFATLVEDKTGPFFGIVAQVQHTFQSNGTASTSITVTNVRDAFVRQGKNRTPFAPNWLNKRFRAQQISDTYSKLFGNNFSGNFAAMVPPGQLTTQEGEAPDDDFKDFFVLDRPNLDELARLVIPVPTYSQDLSQIVDVPDQSIATKIRSTFGNRDRRFLEYQFRAGTSLSQYVDFHELSPRDVDDRSQNPPEDLDTSLGTAGGHKLFGSPMALSFTGKLSNDDSLTRAFVTSEFGLYTVPDGVSPKISRERQDAARLIQRAINRLATED